MKSVLTVHDYEAWVHLGCEPEEQKYTQPVHLTLDIEFSEVLKGLQSDRLQDAVDYVAITEIMNQVSTEKPYHLIEHLNHSVLGRISDYLKSHAISGNVKLTVRKIRVPVERLTGGVSFSCEIRL